ncbi:MAG TPA: RNA polymerase sigma factor [Allosphingosinicella sp.]
MLNPIKVDYRSLPELELARRIADRDEGALTFLMQCNNQRLFRTAWSILKDRDEAEDTLQSAYLKAFASIGSFLGNSTLSTWLTRIVINEALARRRSTKSFWTRLKGSPAAIAHYGETLMGGSAGSRYPDANLARELIRTRLAEAVANLPQKFRIVFVLREIEEMDVAEVAELLNVPSSTVKTRHFRAKERLRTSLCPELKDAIFDSLAFAGRDCAALTGRVLQLHRAGAVRPALSIVSTAAIVLPMREASA